MEKIHEEIKSNLDRFMEFARAKNIDGMVSMFSEDAILVSEQGKAEGRENIKKLYENWMPSFVDGDISSKMVYPIGDKIYEIGTNSMITEVDGQRSEVKGNYVTVWIKEDNNWMVLEDLLPPTPD